MNKRRWVPFHLLLSNPNFLPLVEADLEFRKVDRTMSNELIEYIKMIIDNNPGIERHISSFLDPGIVTFHIYSLKGFSFKEDALLNIAKEIVNDVLKGKRSLNFIYKENDITAVTYFMVCYCKDKGSFEIRYGNVNHSYNQILYSDIKGKSKETLVNCVMYYLVRALKQLCQKMMEKVSKP